MIRIAFHSFSGLWRRNQAFSWLVVACLVSVFACILFLQERGYVSFIESMQDDSDNRTFSFSSGDPHSFRVFYDQLCNAADMPPVENITLSDGNIAGVFWDRSINDNVWYTPYGRFFSDEEMRNGENVVLLGTSYISGLFPEKRDTVWKDGVHISGIDFSAIGSFFFEWMDDIPEYVFRYEVMSANIVIPLQTFLNLDLPAARFRCTFSQQLSEEQINWLKSRVSQLSQIGHLSFPPAGSRSSIASYLQTITASSAILLLAIISLIDIIMHWLKSDAPRYRAFLICGASYSRIFLLIMFHILSLVTLSFISAYMLIAIITYYTPPEIILPLPFIPVILTYLGVTVFTLFVSSVRVFHLVHSKDFFRAGR